LSGLVFLLLFTINIVHAQNLHGIGLCDNCHEAPDLDFIRSGGHKLAFEKFEGHNTFCQNCHIAEECSSCHPPPEIVFPSTTPTAGGGGGGIGGVTYTGNYDVDVYIDMPAVAYQGDSVSVAVTVVNTGSDTLPFPSVYLHFLGLEDSRDYAVNELDTIPPGGSTTTYFTINVKNSAPPGDYQIEVTVEQCEEPAFCGPAAWSESFYTSLTVEKSVVPPQAVVSTDRYEYTVGDSGQAIVEITNPSEGSMGICNLYLTLGGMDLASSPGFYLLSQEIKTVYIDFVVPGDILGVQELGVDIQYGEDCSGYAQGVPAQVRIISSPSSPHTPEYTPPQTPEYTTAQPQAPSQIEAGRENGYETYEVTRRVESEKVSIEPSLSERKSVQSKQKSPEHANCIIKLSSSPTNVRVYVDGVYKGDTPFEGEVDCRSHTVRVEKEGYEPWEDKADFAETNKYDKSITLTKSKTLEVEGYRVDEMYFTVVPVALGIIGFLIKLLRG